MDCLVAQAGPTGLEQETMTLLNTSPAAIDLTGWTIADRNKRKHLLAGELGAGATTVVTLPQDVQLGNKGGIITLLNSEGLKVDGVSYTREQGRREGWTVGEVFGLDLNRADLVVLRACETQLGQAGLRTGLGVTAGDDIVGLTRAFIFAGTPSVIASLWNVEDEATSLLMERFYTHLKDGLGKAEALRQAQIEVRNYEDDGGNRPYQNPYYWSAFVLSGDGGVINLPETTETLSGVAAPANPEVSSSASERGSLALSDSRILGPIILVGLFIVGVFGVAGWQLQKRHKRKTEQDLWQRRLEILHDEYRRLQSTPEGPSRNRALGHINREMQKLKRKLGQRD